MQDLTYRSANSAVIPRLRRRGRPNPGARHRSQRRDLSGAGRGSVPLAPGPRSRFPGSNPAPRKQPPGPRQLSFISAVGRRATGLRRTFCDKRFPAPPGRSPRPRVRPPLRGSIVTGNYFHVLGVSAHSGRVFTADDDRPRRASRHRPERRLLEPRVDRSPAAIGQVLEINGASGTVIGVTPAEFFGETVGALPDVWLPISFQPQFMPADWLNAPPIPGSL